MAALDILLFRFVGSKTGANGHKKEIADSQHPTDDTANQHLPVKVPQQGKNADHHSHASKYTHRNGGGFFQYELSMLHKKPPSIVVVKGYRRIFLLILGQAGHGLKAVAKSVNGGHDTYDNAGPNHPFAPAKAVSQPERQQNESCKGQRSGKTQLGDPNQ